MSQSNRKPMSFSLVDAPVVPQAASNDPAPISNEATKVAVERQQLGARVSKDLYRRFKVHAAQTGVKMDALIEEAMRQYLDSKIDK